MLNLNHTYTFPNTDIEDGNDQLSDANSSLSRHVNIKYKGTAFMTSSALDTKVL